MNAPLLDVVKSDETKRLALQEASRAGTRVTDALGDALDTFQAKVQQGPDGLRVLGFVGGIALAVCGVLGALSIFSAITAPFYYVIVVSQVVFGLTVAVLEADEDVCQRFQFVDRAQDQVRDLAKVLTLAWGRGVFYIYLGAQTVFTYGVSIVGPLLGGYLIVIGVLSMMMYYGKDVNGPVGVLVTKVHDALSWARKKGATMDGARINAQVV